MLFEGRCPRCGGLAANVAGTISCSLCGDYPDPGGEDSVLEARIVNPVETAVNILSQVTPEQTAEKPETPKEPAPVLSEEAVTFSLGSSLTGALPTGEALDVHVHRCVEFLLGYVEAGEGLPEVSPGDDEQVDLKVRLLLQQESELKELSCRFQIPLSSLVGLAVAFHQSEREEQG